MKIKQILGRIFPLIDGDSLKRQVARQLLKRPMKNEGVINIHRHDLTNVGDYYCAPYLYFEELQGKFLDISGMRDKHPRIRKQWIDEVSRNSLIIGGGGLLNLRHFEIQMELFESLADKGKKMVIWGAGHNAIDYESFNASPKYNVNVERFGLVGLRDYSMPFEWVPCVSCMHQIFDQTYESQREVGFVIHKKRMKNKALLQKLQAYDLVSNRASLEEIVPFIGSTETVVTDSYHAMYWATLMGKKAIGIPSTSKFFDLKHQPLLSTFDTFESDLSKAYAFSGLLEEYRERNLNFAAKVFNYLNL